MLKKTIHAFTKSFGWHSSSMFCLSWNHSQFPMDTSSIWPSFRLKKHIHMFLYSLLDNTQLQKKLLNLYHIHQRHCCTTMCPCQYLQHTLSCVHVVATLSHDGKPVGLVGDALVGFHGVVLTPTIFLCNSPTKATARIDWPWGCLPAHLVQKAIQVGFPETCPYCLCSWASRFRTV